MPKVYAAMMEGVGIITPSRILPACLECNILAGARVFQTVGDKRRYVQSKIRQKYARVLAAPSWTDEEIDDLGFTLRTHVRHCQVAKKLTVERLAWRGSQLAA